MSNYYTNEAIQHIIDVTQTRQTTDKHSPEVLHEVAAVADATGKTTTSDLDFITTRGLRYGFDYVQQEIMEKETPSL